ncbi:MAG: maleylpyruvate isomerase family mycothiol-dependent enzyme [Actinomycetia bacterium]|nr:maleylpyruvate isomerase family mycothiol-dependent enzyme [Actinomycetes bacterium]
MQHTEHLAALSRDGAAFANACEVAGLATSVDSCPGWSVADLVWHLTEVHQFWRTIVGEQRSTWEGFEQTARPSDNVLLDTYRAGFNDTLAVLSAADPEQPNWTWSSDHSARFVIRRMAHETAVHRWDADAAAGRRAAIDSELASDGIDEFLTHMLGDATADASTVGGSVHLHCTDVAGEWTVRESDDGGRVVTREHAKGDAALRGTASDLLLALWRRQDLAGLDVIGDVAIAARFIAIAALD